MSGDFDWRTDDDSSWDKPPSARPKSRKRPVPLILTAALLSLIIIFSGIFVYQLVKRRSTGVAESVETDILTVHQLISQADQQDDLGLFRSSLSGRHQLWAEVQQQLLISGSLMDRPGFNLQAMTTLPESEEIEGNEINDIDILLSPDLTSAEVQFNQSYQVEEGLQEGAVIELRQTAVYRLGSRWLLAAPHKEFWGDRESFEGQALRTSFPDRDRNIVERLSTDMDILIQEACRILADLNCPETLVMNISFEEDIETFINIEQDRSYLYEGLDLHLPSPTLVGLPMDELGYQALLGGYSQLVISSLVFHQAGYSCCQQGPFYQALLEAQLQEVGLRFWPLDTSTRRNVERSAGSSLYTLDDVGLFWSSEEVDSPVEDIWPVYALIEFLGDLTGLSASAIQRNLSLASQLPDERGYQSWLGINIGNLAMSRVDLEKAWLAFKEEAFPTLGLYTPMPPNQNLLASCQSNGELGASLYSYNVVSGLIELEHPLEGESAFITSLPDDTGVIIAAASPDSLSTESQLLLWKDDQLQVILESEDSLIPLPFMQFSKPGGEDILVLNRRARQYFLYPMQECLSTPDCPGTAFNGFPIWSPDGSSFLLLVTMGSYGYEKRLERPLWVGGITAEVLGNGKEPFWMDDNIVVFISSLGRELLSSSTADGSQQVLLTTDDIHDLLRSNQVSIFNELALEYAAVDPVQQDSLLIIASDESNVYFLSADQQGENLDLRHITGDFSITEFGTDFHYSPDGRWLVISAVDPSYSLSTITFYDTTMAQSQTNRFHGLYVLPMHWQIDWSSDGEWLSIINSGYIRLFNPGSGFQKLLVPDDLTCTAAAWIN